MRRLSHCAPWLVAVAIALLALALLSLPWFRDGGGFFHSAADDSFYELHLALDRARRAAESHGRSGDVQIGLSGAYFGWLGWTLPGVAIVVALGAVFVPRRPSGPVRAVGTVLAVAGALLGTAGVVLSGWALDLVGYSGAIAARMPVNPPRFGDYLAHAWWGAWCALLGYALLAVASLIGRIAGSVQSRRLASRT